MSSTGYDNGRRAMEIAVAQRYVWAYPWDREQTPPSPERVDAPITMETVCRELRSARDGQRHAAAALEREKRTLLDGFAQQAMTAMAHSFWADAETVERMMSNGEHHGLQVYAWIARESYDIADAMMAERARRLGVTP